MKKVLLSLFAVLMISCCLMTTAFAGVGDYEFNEKEYNDTFDEANMLYSDYTVYASMDSSSDKDVFAITLYQNSTIQFITSSLYSSAVLYLYDEYGDYIASADMEYDGGYYMNVIAGSLPAGTYFFKIYDYYGYTYDYLFYYQAQANYHTHSYTKKVTKQPTCSKTGTATYTCSCGESYTQTIAATGKHSYSAYKSDGNATYTQDGTKTAKCTYSGCTATKTVTDTGSMKKLGTTSKITVTQYGASYVISWNKISGAKGYRVLVSTDSGWKTLQNSSGTSYEAIGLNMGQDYTFAVRAYIKTDDGTIWAPKYKTVSFTVTPEATEITKVTQGTDTVTLTWNKSENATGYRVFMRVNNSWKTLKNTTATSYKVTGLKPGTAYKFTVRSYAKVDSTTVWASTYKAFNTTTKPATPVVKVASTAKGRATVAWADVNGETGYQVYYSTAKTSGYKKIANYAAGTTKIYKTGLTSGKTYYFRVRAYTKTDNGYIYSSYSPARALIIK